MIAEFTFQKTVNSDPEDYTQATLECLKNVFKDIGFEYKIEGENKYVKIENHDF